MTGLQAAIEWVQDQASSLPGVRSAPDYLPENTDGKFPFFAAWPGSGTWESGSAGMEKGLLSIYVELHVERKKGLPAAIKEAMKYVETFPKMILADTTLGATVSTIEGIDFDGLVSMSYAGVDTVGFRWSISGIKIQS